MASVFQYIFDIVGNFTATINGMSSAAGSFTAQVEKHRVVWTNSQRYLPD